MSPCRWTASFFISGLSGPMESPSPKTSSVTPCIVSLSPRPSAMRLSTAQLSMLMKPGETAMPDASTVLFAVPVASGPT